MCNAHKQRAQLSDKPVMAQAEIASVSESLGRWLSPPRSRRVLHLLGIVWLLGAADLFFTAWASRFTPFHELNPIARDLLHQGLIGQVILMKLILLSAGTLLLWHARYTLWAELSLWLIAALHVVVILQWSQYVSMMMLPHIGS